MPDLELKPSEWRLKSLKRPKRHISTKALKWWMTGCGVWAGTWLYCFRYFIDGDSPWVAAAVVGLPGLCLWTWLVVTERPD